MKRRLLHSIAFVGVLSLPLLQALTGLVPERKLGGVEEPPPPLEASVAAWHDGRLQAAMGGWFESHLGLRGWMIRVDNQLREWLFGETRRPVVRGSDGWLFAGDYLPGCDLAVDEKQKALLLRVRNLSRMQALLAEHGVQVMLVVSPSKTRLFAEHLPADQQAVVRDTTLPTYYEFVAPFLRASGVVWIDGPSRFRQWRQEGRAFPLFARGGAHWSAYASAETARLLLDRLRAEGVPARSCTIHVDGYSERPQGMENDLAAMANVFDELRYFEPTPIPRIEVQDGDTGRPLRILAEGTSFGWGLMDMLSQHDIAVPLSYLYYLYTRHDYIDGVKQPKRAKAWQASGDLRQELLDNDVILFEINERMLPAIGHGMIEAALLLFGQVPQTEVDDGMRDYMRRHGRR
jgi:hypothetical protein